MAQASSSVREVSQGDTGKLRQDGEFHIHAVPGDEEVVDFGDHVRRYDEGSRADSTN